MENGATLTLEAHQIGLSQPLLSRRQIDLPESWSSAETALTLKQLIRLIVLQEVEAFQKRQTDQQLFRVLTEQQIESGKAVGRIDPAARNVQQQVNAEESVAVAWQSFEDGLFYVFIDGRQIDSLNEPVQINNNSTLKFIRLVALAGG